MTVSVPADITKLEDLIGPGIMGWVDFLGEQIDVESCEIFEACQQAFETVRNGGQDAAKMIDLHPERRQKIIEEHNSNARAVIAKLSVFDCFTIKSGILHYVPSL